MAESIRLLIQKVKVFLSIHHQNGSLYHRGGIILAGILVCLYSLSVLLYVLTTPEIGVRCAFTPVVNYFYEDEFLFPASQEPLQEGDRITEVGPFPVETWSQFLRGMVVLSERSPQTTALTEEDLLKPQTLQQFSHVSVAGQPLVRVKYLRGGDPTPRVVWCRFTRSPLESLVPSIIWFFLKIGLFVVGAIIYWQKADDPSAARFFWLCIVTLGAFMGGYHWSRIVTQPILLVVFMSCAVLLPAVTLHFYLVFPRPRPFFERHERTILFVVYGIPVVFLLMLLRGYLYLRLLHYNGQSLISGFDGSLGSGVEAPPSGVQLLLIEMLYEIYFYFGVAALFYLGSVASLIYSYRTAINAIERNQVKWILLGSALAIVPISYTLYLAFFEQGRFGGGAATWPMFAASASITLAYTFSMTRYRLMQLDHLISSGAIYFLISTLAGLVYYGVVFGGLLLVGSRVHDAPSLSQVLGVAGAALVFMVALDVVRGRLLRVLDRHLRREKYQLDRTLQRMSQTIESLVDTPTLGRQVLQTTTDLLSATNGAIYLRQGEPPLFRLMDSLGTPPPLSELSPGFPLVEALKANPLLGPEINSGSPAGRQLTFLGGGVAQGLVHEGQLQGIVVLGKRAEGPYTQEELQILSAFARIAVLALVSADGHRTIETLNEDLKSKVEKIAEQQRRIIALQSQLMKREDRKSLEQQSTLVSLLPATEAPVATINGDTAASSAITGLVGSSVQVQQLLQLVRRVANSSSAVLLRGESGTGKELVARALHENSPRANRPFIKVHCAALSPGLLESELFGHVKGAFTSAIKDKVGRFEAADGGTLLLDEIGDISLEVQTKLLRVLEEMTFERVGSNDPVHVDVRIITATHRDLETMITDGKFREDLYFRLNVLPIHVPALRERVEDIPELADYFLHVYSSKLGKQVKLIDDDALAALKGYSWPGNVRQLENVIERAVVITESGKIGLPELPEEVKETRLDQDLPTNRNGTSSTNGFSLVTLASIMQDERQEWENREREQLIRALSAAGGNKSEAARALGMARSTLMSRLKRLGLV